MSTSDWADTIDSSPAALWAGIANNEALSEDEIERALISGLPAEEFGSTAANDPKLQPMVDEVVRMLRQEPAGRMFLAKAIGELIGDRK